MPRYVKVAAAQMGPNNEGTSREEIVERMQGLLERAVAEDVEILAYPEMALTTYFPKRVRDDYDQFFETEMPPKALAPLLQRAREARIACHVGFCEKDQGRYFNTALLTDEAAAAARERSGRSTFRAPSSRTATPRSTSPTSSSRATPATASSTPPRPRSASRSARTGASRVATGAWACWAPRSC